MSKSNAILSVLFLLLVTGSLLFSCQKLGKLIAVETGGSTNINASGVELDAIVVDVGEGGLTEHGWCIGTDHNPTVNDIKIDNGAKAKYGNYVNIISGLKPETKYYTRSYACGGEKVVYGKELEFTTSILNFIFTNSWENRIIGKGLTYSIDWSANINDKLKIELYNGDKLVKLLANEIDNTGSYDWTVNNNLQDGSDYKLVISSVENEKLKTETQAFSILESSPPLVISGDLSSIAYFTAIADGRIEHFGTENQVIQHGHCWSTNENPTIDDSKTELGIKNLIGSFTSNLTELEDNTTYYVRAYAVNNIGVNYGQQKVINTLDALKPEVSTSEPTNISYTTAKCSGEVSSSGTHSITSRGICWNTSPNPTIDDNKTIEGSGTGTFASDISGLTDNITYYVRAYATSEAGTGYGLEKAFTTLDLPEDMVVDIDGNVYHTVKIGSQIWMSENLKTTKFNDGTDIPLVTENAVWSDLTTPGYCWYNNDSTTYAQSYGALYNWYTIETYKLCPNGWHLPTYTDLTTLFDFLGGKGVAGEKLKETGTTHWNSPNIATNETGFGALPGGWRSNFDGSFFQLGNYGNWWSSTEYSSDQSYYIFMQNDFGNVVITNIDFDKGTGISIRCIR